MRKFEQIMSLFFCTNYSFILQQYETREVEFENRIVQKFDLQIDGFQNEIKHLEKQVKLN